MMQAETVAAQAGAEGAALADGGGGEGARASKTALFLRACIPDYILCLAVSAALARTVLNAFIVDDSLAGDIVLSCAVMVPTLALLFASSFSRRLLPLSIGGCVVMLVACAAIGAGMSSGASPLAESEGNCLIPLLVWVVVPIIVFLLSRRVWGLAALLLLSVVTCGVVEFLYDGHMVVPFIVVVVGVIALFVFQTYRQSIVGSRRVAQTGFGAAFAGACAVAAVSVGIAAAVFFGIIAPLNPPAAELKLFQEHYALETVEFSSVFEDPTGEDPDETTDQTDNDDEQTNDDKSQQNGENDDPTDQNPAQAAGEALTTLASAFSMQEEPEDYTGISYNIIRITSLIVFVLIVAAIVAAVLLKRRSRERRLAKLEGLANEQKVVSLYGFFESRLARMGFKRGQALTAGEYAVASYRGMKAFSRDTGNVSFLNVTEVFYRARYGHLEVSDEDYGRVERFYRAFFKNARRYVGWPKWIAWKFWRI